ncbi:hypothetical protein BKA70DRAFT_885333 [Coprinopsis sp. MPI-PUGE-AT-0042]|nr:hypothetical protein BKA70DRAFT_885333 [Coprinopsis sp. MPI-PUGE-AT-0042]
MVPRNTRQSTRNYSSYEMFARYNRKNFVQTHKASKNRPSIPNHTYLNGPPIHPTPKVATPTSTPVQTMLLPPVYRSAQVIDEVTTDNPRAVYLTSTYSTVPSSGPAAHWFVSHCTSSSFRHGTSCTSQRPRSQNGCDCQACKCRESAPPPDADASDRAVGRVNQKLDPDVALASQPRSRRQQRSSRLKAQLLPVQLSQRQQPVYARQSDGRTSAKAPPERVEHPTPLEPPSWSSRHLHIRAVAA